MMQQALQRMHGSGTCSCSYSLPQHTQPGLMRHTPQRPQQQHHHHHQRQPRRTAAAAAATTTATSAAAAAVTLDDGSTLGSVCRELDALLARAAEVTTSTGGGTVPSLGAAQAASAAAASAAADAEARAVALARLAAQRGLLRAFGRGRQLPKRVYTIDELRLNRIEPQRLLSPTDESLNAVRTACQAAAAAGLAALGFIGGADRAVAALAAASFALVFDQVGNAGGGEALVVDTLGRAVAKDYARRVALHEAGHLLVAYLVGLLPRDYTLSSLGAFARHRALNVQAGTHFCDGDFAAEVAAGRLSSASLDRFTCVALAGVVTEYLRFGRAEGGVGDVAQLDRLLRALGFTQKKADAQVRWAVLNAAALLRRHAAAHDALAAAMARGEPVAALVELLEVELARQPDQLAPEPSIAGLTATATSGSSGGESESEDGGGGTNGS